MFKVRGGIPSKYVEMGLKVFFGFVLVFSMFMAAGGIYNLMEKPLALLPLQRQCSHSNPERKYSGQHSVCSGDIRIIHDV